MTMQIPGRVQDLTGRRFHRLLVIGYSGKNRQSESMWRCRCDCGRYHIVRGTDMKTGHCKSCGCLAHEFSVSRGKDSATHGMHSTPTHRTWTAMKSRCSNPRDSNYPNYGGRGIGYCKEWETFVAFLRDMGERPKGMSLDRVDNNKGYAKDNCRWATPVEQTRNRRNTRMITFRGETMCLTAWAERYDMRISTLFTRLFHGWTIERALTQPRQKRRKNHGPIVTHQK
jgi:hypothetical protein